MRRGERSVPGAETTFTGFSVSSELDGAACAELNPAIAHKFFDIDYRRDVLRRKAAQNICGRCVVAPECLEIALHGPAAPLARGVIAGVSASEVRRARSWISYELGVLGSPPQSARPAWLPRSEAAETAEQMRVELEDGVDR